jgi:hypothetical protein
MIPLIPLSPAESSRLTGTQAVNAKTISENDPHTKDQRIKVRYGR